MIRGRYSKLKIPNDMASAIIKGMKNPTTVRTVAYVSALSISNIRARLASISKSRIICL